MPEYAGKTCIIGFQTGAANGDSYVCALDNVSIGTKPQRNLAVDVLKGEDMPTAGGEYVYSVSVANTGSESQEGYTLRLMEEGKEEALLSLQGEELASGDYKICEFPWTPAEAGEHGLYAEVVSDGDEDGSDDRTAALDVEVQEAGTYAITVGDGSSLAYSPVNMWNRESASQTIYYPWEIGANTGVISAIEYQSEFDYPTMVDAPRVRIYVGETDKEDFSDKQWVDVAGLQPVFDGKLRQAGSGDTWRVEFEDPYEYQGGNLVVYAVMTDWSSGVMSNNFRNTNYPGTSRTISIATEQVPTITPENPNPQGWNVSISDAAPDVSFFMRFEDAGSISGTVSVAEGGPVEDVKVSVQGSSLYAMSDAQGRYRLPYLASGKYALTASKSAYVDTTFELDVANGQAVVADLVLRPEKTLVLSGKVRRADNGMPVYGASVSVDGLATYTASTDAEGTYRIEGLYLGETWSMRVSSAGFLTYDTVIVMDSMDAVVDVALDESPRPVQLLQAGIVDSNAHVDWLRPDSIAWKDFRYDSDVRMGQLGLTESLPRAVLGTVYRTPAELYEMSWFNSTDGSQSAPELADIYILGLDSAGMPSGQVLYSAKGIENKANVWNTHVLSHPVKAPDGFMVAIGNAYGFCGLGIAVGTDAYPFVENANFYSQDYATGPYISLEDSRYQLNFMIRASGISLLESGEEAGSGAGLAGGPEYYEVYRFSEGQPETAWTLLETVRQPGYVDSAWSGLASGVYYYAVKAAYARLVSVPSISEALPKDMHVEVNVDLSANTGESVVGAVLTLANVDSSTSHVYSMVAGDGPVVFPSVWKGNYKIQVALEGYALFEADGLPVFSDTVLEIVLKEDLSSPYGLRVDATEDPASKLFSWNNDAEVVFIDDVEGYEDFIIEGIGNYNLVDGDGGPTWVMAFSESGAYEYPNNGYTGSFQVLNPYETVPLMTGLVMPHSGRKVLACADANASYGPGNNDDWLILPKLSVSENMEFRFYAKGVGNAAMYGYERMNVGVSTEGNAPEDFTFFNGEQYIEVPDTEWTEYVFDLSGYEGQEIYLAINCVSANSFMLVLDDLYVGTAPERKRDAKVGGKADAKSLSTYVVYLDGEEAGRTEDFSYRFESLSEGLHTAGVKAVYTTGESEVVSKEFEVDLPHRVVFQVVDGNNQPVEDATIVFDGDTLVGYVVENVFNGTYDYVVGKEGYSEKSGTVTMAGSDVSVVVTLSGVGNESMAGAGISLYPNPFTEEIFLTKPGLAKWVCILDMNGKKMLEIASPEASIPVSTLPSGAYMVVLETTSGETVSCKMIKKLF